MNMGKFEISKQVIKQRSIRFLFEENEMFLASFDMDTMSIPTFKLFLTTFSLSGMEMRLAITFNKAMEASS